MTAIATPIVLPSAGRYRSDPARTTVAVKVTHLVGLGAVTATCALRDADVTVGETDTATTVHAGSVASGTSTREGDIRAPTFLDTAATPAIPVEIRAVTRSTGKWTGGAPITAHGVPPPVAGTLAHVAQRGTDLTLKGSARIDRDAHGITAAKGKAWPAAGSPSPSPLREPATDPTPCGTRRRRHRQAGRPRHPITSKPSNDETIRSADMIDLTDTISPALSKLDDAGGATLFTDARTANTFAATPVSDAALTAIWNLAKWAPTSANTQLLRILYVHPGHARERLVTHLKDGNKAKTALAPAVAVLAVDTRFHDYIPTLLPFRPELKDVFDADEEMRTGVGMFNATLQAGYFILAIRAHGLAAGPMAGFDATGIDAAFFPDGRWRSILVVNIGHPGPNPWFARLPRLDHEDTIRWA